MKTARNAKSKAGTPLSPYMAHLYAKNELLKQEEQQTYEELLDIQKYGGPEYSSGKESNLAEFPIPSPTGSVKRSNKKKLNMRGLEEKAMKTKKKAGSSRPDYQEEIRTKERTPGSVKLAGDPREEIVQFCTEIAKRTTILHERECRMDGLIQAIANVVGRREPDTRPGR